MKVAGATLLSIDAARTLMIDGDAIVQAANAANIAIVGRPPAPAPAPAPGTSTQHPTPAPSTQHPAPGTQP
jgi:hypothetical protein